MADVVMTSVLESMLDDIVAASSGGDLVCALLTEDAAGSISSSLTLWSQLVTYEVVGTGYTAGGEDILNATGTDGKLDADDVVWANSDIIARFAVVYESVGGKLIAVFDFGANKESSSGNFTVSWHDDGILNLSQV